MRSEYIVAFFFVLTLLPAGYFSVRLWRNTLWSAPIKLACTLILVAISQCYSINILVFGGLAGPNMPSWLLVAQLCLFFTLIFCFLLAVVGNVCKGIRSLIGKMLSSKERESSQAAHTQQAVDMSRRRFVQGSLASVGCVAAPVVSLATSAYGIDSGMSVPFAHMMQASIPNLPKDLEGIRIAHITDIHIGPLTSKEWLNALVTRVNAWQPDLICITGDIADGLQEYSAPGGIERGLVAQELAQLKAKYGVYGCTGNHEYISDYAGWMALYERVGIRMLLNESVSLQRGKAELILTGLNDRAARRRGLEPGQAQQVLAKTPGLEENAFRLVMDHQPGRAAENALAGAHLQLSGHTHGGHVAGMAQIVARANKGFVRGWYTVDTMPLYVSTGAGLWSGFAFRLGVPAEVALISLQQGQTRLQTRSL